MNAAIAQETPDTATSEAEAPEQLPQADIDRITAAHHKRARKAERRLANLERARKGRSP